MKKPTCLVFSIPVEVYNTDIAVHVSNDKLYIEKLEKTFGEKMHGNEIGMWYETEHAGGLLWLRHKPNTPERHGSLSHEVSHAVKSIMTSRGIDHSEETDEAYAYLQGFIVRKVLGGIRDYDKPQKTKARSSKKS